MNASLRILIFQRDGFTCQYCGARAPHVELHVDHVVPKSKGGSNHHTNLVTACKECNLGKGAKPIVPGNWGERDLSLLNKLPKAPVVQRIVQRIAAPLRKAPRLPVCLYCKRSAFPSETCTCGYCNGGPFHADECIGLHVEETICSELRTEVRSAATAIRIEYACVTCGILEMETACYDCALPLCADCSFWCEDERYCADCIECARASAGELV